MRTLLANQRMLPSAVNTVPSLSADAPRVMRLLLTDVMKNGTARGVLGRAASLALMVALTLGYGCLISWGAHPFDAIFWLVLWAGPAIVPSALVGGAIAGAVARVRPEASPSAWLLGGGSVGAVVGALSLGAWFAVGRFPDGSLVDSQIIAIAGIAALVGVVTGGLTGLYCSRLMRSRVAV